MTVTTVTLPRSGAVVLAKPYKGDLSAVHYVNRTQAEKKVAELTADKVACHVWQPRLGPVFYVRFGAE